MPLQCGGNGGVGLRMAEEGMGDELMACNPLVGGVWPAWLLVQPCQDCGGVTFPIVLSAGGLTRGAACKRLGKGTVAAMRWIKEALHHNHQRAS